MEAENKQTMRKQAQLIKIELNDKGDYIAISTGDNTLFDRFAAGCKQIESMANDARKKLKRIERKYKGWTDLETVCKKVEEIARTNVQFSQNAIKVIDSILGEGTVTKYFRSLYEEVPDFLPSAECFIDFFNKIIPIMEKLFNRKMDEAKRLG